MTTHSSSGVLFVTDPLTTVFTPPASCSSTYSLLKPIHGVLRVQRDGYSPGLGTKSSCYPPNFYNHAWIFRSKEVHGIYSPGVCPSGYHSPVTWASTGATTAVCCASYVDFHPALARPLANSSFGQGISRVALPSTVDAREWTQGLLWWAKLRRLVFLQVQPFWFMTGQSQLRGLQVTWTRSYLRLLHFRPRHQQHHRVAY